MRLEIAALAFLGTGVVVIVSPTDPALSWLPMHPMWALAVVLAARYGARGLWLAPALAIGLVMADLLVGGGGAAVIERLSRGGDLAALAAAGLCAAVGTAHERRKRVLEERLLEAEARALAAETSVDELTKLAVALRDRCDRSATSMAFLVDVAVRMSGSDPVVTSDAALELAMARSGALGGFLQLRDAKGQLRTSTSRGPAIANDLTAAAAVEHATVVSADEILGVRPEDSDLAAPLLDEDGQVIGVLALHLVPYSALGPAARADLTAIARWAARSLSPERAAQDSRTFDVREVLYAHA
jgi:hypothetical protein